MSGDARLVFEAWRRLALARLALTLLPWRTASRLLTVSPLVPSDASVERIIRAVRLASRVVPGSSCLSEALALQALLARRGRVGILHLGVKTTVTAGLEAHAWLELDGATVLGEGPRPGFEPLLSRPADR